MQIVTDQFQKEMKKHGSDAFPILVSHEQLSRYPSGSFLWHWHPEIEVTLITEGQMLYKVNQCTFHLKKGEILMENANVLHAGFMENFQDCRYISVTFDPKLIYGFYQSIICRKYVDPVIQNFSLPAIHIDYSEEWHKAFAEKIQNIIHLNEEKTELYELDTVIELQSAWRCLLANKSRENTGVSYNKLEHERIKDIMDYLEKNYSNKILLEDIAEHIHLCKSECSRLFKRCMNISLFAFLQEYRVERSLEYLLDPQYSITEIAEKAGFTDSNYYSKVFSKVKGCSPVKYRKQYVTVQ